MSTTSATIGRVRWTARELRKLPAHERDRILEAAAKEAENEYRTNRDLTDFEARLQKKKLQPAHSTTSIKLTANEYLEKTTFGERMSRQ